MENNEVKQDACVEEVAEQQGNNEEKVTDAKKPILPDEEYAAKVAEEDAEELEKARSRLMIMLRRKCACLGNATLEQQLKPMVYSMSISDCNNMYNVIDKHGLLGLTRMAMKHNKAEKKAAKQQ